MAILEALAVGIVLLGFAVGFYMFLELIDD